MTVYVFPGQGSQFKGMGKNLFPLFPELVQEADEILGYSIKSLCLDDNEKINKTEYTQPALYVINALSYQNLILKDNYTKADYLAGHSLGEYSALYASGVLTFGEGLKIVKKRGELMSKAIGGSMAAVLKLSSTQIKDILIKCNLSSIDIANYNSELQTVISGLENDIISSKKFFEEAGGIFIPLNTSGAFHSRYMEPISLKFAKFIESIKFSKPKISIINNVYSRPYFETDSFYNILIEQIKKPVDWLNSIIYLLGKGETQFFELGPGDVLTKLINNIKKDYFDKSHLKKKILSDNKDIIESVSEIDNSSSNTNNTAQKEKIANDVVKNWNKLYPIGTSVKVEGYNDLLETSSKAIVLFGHRPAIYLKTYKGYFSLDDVNPISV